MAESQDERVEIFRRIYIPKLIDACRPSRVLLFGSRAKGAAIKESDLDLLIVSKSFEDQPFIHRASELLWTLQVPFPVELLCYTPEEFERKKKELGIVRIAAEEGIDLI